MKKIFLETSILIQRLLYEDRRKAQIETNLVGKEAMSSQYVIMELRRNTLQAINYLRTHLSIIQNRGIDETKLNEFLIILSRARAIFRSPRAVQSVLLAFSLIAESFESGYCSTDQLIRELGLHIERLEVEAKRGVSRIVNQTHCDLVKEDALLGDFISSRLSCNAGTAQCQLVPFLSAHREQLLTIQQAMESAPKEKVDQRMLSALRKVNTDVTKALGERTCWALGDVIIALEAPDDALIYTADGHFEILTKAIGKRIYRSPNL